jgi:hypothetical protein
MKISHLITILQELQKNKGDLEIPFQICYEKLFKNGELNSEFIKKFGSDDLFEYYCSELKIPHIEVERAAEAYKMACYYHPNSRITQFYGFLKFLDLAGIYYEAEQKSLKDLTNETN